MPNLITFGDDNRTISIETTDDNTKGFYKLKFTMNIFYLNFTHTEIIYVDLRVIVAEFSVTINSAPWFEVPL